MRILRLLKPCLGTALMLAVMLLGSMAEAVGQSSMPTPERLAGLRRMRYLALLQSSQGPIWMGTSSGLLEYNGMDVRSYDRRDSLRGERGTALAEDQRGRIWIGHENGLVSIYDPRQRQIGSFAPQEGTPRKRITAMLAARNGYLWFATDSVGIWYWDGERMYMLGEEDGLLNKGQSSATSTAADSTLDAELAELEGLVPGIQGGVELTASKVETYCLYEDTDGTLWAGTDAGIVRIDLNLKGKERFSYLSTPEGLVDNIVRGIVGDGEGLVWIAMGDSGLCSYDWKSKQLKRAGSWAFGMIQTLVYHPILKQLWIGTRKGEVVVYTPATGRYLLFEKLPAAVLSLLVDHEGNVLAGTEQSIHLYAGERQRMLRQAQGLPSNNVQAVYAAPDGWVYVGTDKGAARTRIDGSRQMQTETIPLVPIGGGAVPQVISIAPDRFGRLWFGTFGNGVYSFDPLTRRIQNFSMRNGLPSNDVYAIVGDYQKSAWLGTLGGGLVQVRFTDDGNIAGVRNYTATEGIEAAYLFALHADSQGYLWIATDGYGLYRFDGRQFVHYDERRGLPARTVYALASDLENKIWIATEGFGLLRFDGADFVIYESEKGFRHDSPFALAVDSLGQVYVGNRFGIDVYNPALDQVRYYGEGDGLGAYEPLQNAVSIHDQVLWWGTTNGLLRLAPFSTVPARVAPRVSINRLRIFLRDSPFLENAVYPYDQNHLTFDYIGVSLSSPNKVLYQYKLEGFEDEWSFASDIRFHTYSNLPPGQYRFVVRADNGTGVFSEAAYSFEIRPPFWQTWWFYSLSTIVLVGGGYLTFRLRVRRIEQEKRILEEKVEERTREISHQKEIIEEKNRDITESIEYARRLQFAILPEIETIRRDLPDSFVFYRPKDIVSGDFYWFNRVKDQWIIAGVDCTGHGVPGAFMSVVGFNQLNEVVNSHTGQVSPEEILNLLDIRVRIVLRQDSAASVTKDGMDVALCALDPQTGVLKYAGAYRPLYVVHRGEFLEFKGDRFPIGGAQQELKEFKLNTIELEPGDCFYIFSDGIVDQFGGPNLRKFTPKRLKELIVANHHKPMTEQHLIYEQAILDWMAGTEQLDDMLIIGIRYTGA